jgi:hypothetical protein
MTSCVALSARLTFFSQFDGFESLAGPCLSICVRLRVGTKTRDDSSNEREIEMTVGCDPLQSREESIERYA